jgi:hypothetical protein
MRSRAAASGAALLLIASLPAVAQMVMPRQGEPMDAALQAVWQARDPLGPDAAAARAKALDILRQAPAASPRMGAWTQQIAQLYAGAGFNAKAREILEEGLARLTPLGDSNPTRIGLLSVLANNWRQDGNLLKALHYFELAAAARVQNPNTANSAYAINTGQPTHAIFIGSFSGALSAGNLINTSNAYIALANLNLELGRPEAAADAIAKLRSHASTDEAALAAYYEQHGQIDEAAGILRSLPAQADTPQAKMQAWQSLAWFEARQKDLSGAISAMRQAVAIAESNAESSRYGQPVWMKQSIADFLREAGRTEEADQLYQQLLQQTYGQPQESETRAAYGQYLAGTQRETQGEEFLKNYLASSTLDAGQRNNLLNSLANIARTRGDYKSAEAYQKQATAEVMAPASADTPDSRISEIISKAQEAANQRHFDDAYHLAMQAIDAARAGAEEMPVVGLSGIASALAYNQQPEKSEEIYSRLFTLAYQWQSNSLQPLIGLTRNYTQFLMAQPARSAEVPAAIEQFRKVLLEANGADSATLAEPIRVEIQFARNQAQWQKAAAAAHDLLDLQASLSGKTSEPYLSDLELAGGIYQSASDYAQALTIFRQAMAISDRLTGQSSKWQRGQSRINAALALAQLGQFDEAEALAAEAAKFGGYSYETQQIAQLKKVAVKAK